MRAELISNIDGLSLRAFHYAALTDESGNTRNTLLFCLPGGGASAAYFDLAPSHSFARRMTQLGYDVVVMDCPGTSTNPLPEQTPFILPREMSDYIAKAFMHWQKNHWTKTMRVIGIGHSMGGMLMTLIQARHKPFEAIALFGSSAGGLAWGLSEEEKKYIDQEDLFAKDIEKLTLGKFGRYFTPTPAGPSGKSITFGGETPELTQSLRDVSCELYCAGGMMSMTRGSFKTDVEAIYVPIFFAFGDHDIGIPPTDAPKDYLNAPTTELVILDNTGHNHFAFSSITKLCASLDDWLSNL